MKALKFLLIGSILFMMQCKVEKQPEKPALAPVKPVTETYFGKEITDPYRYMENLQDSTVLKWIKAQSDYARAILDKISGRKELIDKMKAFDARKSVRIYNVHITENDQYFYLKQTPSDETGKLFHRNGFTGTEELLFDPSTYSNDSTIKYVISAFYPTLDGAKVALEVAPNGSESATLLIMSVSDKKLFPEKIDRCWFAEVSWLPGDKTILYNRLNSSDVHNPDREKNSKTYLHMIGSDPSADKDFFSRSAYPDLGIMPEEIPMAFYDKDSKYLFGLVASVNPRIKAFYAPYSELNKGKIQWKTLIKEADNVYNFATTEKDLYLFTPQNAPNFKITRTSLAKPDITNAAIVVPESKESSITGFAITKDGLYYTTSTNGVLAKLYQLPTGVNEPKEIKLPSTAGSIYMLTKGIKYGDIWVTESGWVNESRRYKYLPETGTFRAENLSTPVEYPEYADLVVEELEVPSHDGAKVPLSLVYNKNLKKDGKNPVFFYGYGAYGIPMDPFFSPDFLLWTAEGGILAIPHVRGGGEKGDAWYKAGYKTTKPNTWKDLIACAEYMVNNKYTDKGKIAINSASAGGILIGRAMTERPDLFAVAIPEVGVMNPLRAENSPNGPVNVPEFGTVKDSVECMALIEMDSYLHIKDGVKYPATLITAGMNDPRVIVWEPAKFAASLMAADKSDKPVLFFTDYSAGHGMGNTKTKQFESLADVLSFALWQTGNKNFKLK